MPGVGDLDDEDEFSDNDYPRYPGDLSAEEKAILQAIKSPQDIKDCHVMHTFVDDHVLGAEVVINGVQFGAWWAGWQVIGAMLYSDSKKAGPVIVEFLQRLDWEPVETADDEITEDDLPQ